jgi:DNA-binding response OmpR family regulator
LETPVSVLAVDDPAGGLAELLAGHGFRVRMAADGLAALASAASDPPDAVVAVVAVLGMAGWEFLRRLRAECSWPPFTVTLSESGREEGRARDGDAHLHLVRPTDLRVLAPVLRHLRRHGGSRSGDFPHAPPAPDR